MKILFLMLNNFGKDFYEKLCQVAEEMTYNIVGLVTPEPSLVFSEVKGYPVYPIDYLNKLQWDITIVGSNSQQTQFIAQNILGGGVK